jgi:gamma-glutamylcyclotransferase (GGCT)/AIG2-like uncharacterized protein YtfP
MIETHASLFAYGSLQLPEIFRAVTDMGLPSVPAVLDGYRRTSLRGFEFPGLYPDSSAITEGVLYQGVSAEAWLRLDRFEADFYERRTLSVRLAHGVSQQAEVYVLREASWALRLDLPWTLADLSDSEIKSLLSGI